MTGAAAAPATSSAAPDMPDVPEAIDLPGLRLRAARPADAQAIHAAVCGSLAELRPWMPWAQAAPSMAESLAVAQRMHDDFAARRDLPMPLWALDAEGREIEVIGGSGLHRIDWSLRRFEIGYWRRSGCGGRGVVTAAVRALTRLAFDRLDARRVEIRMDARNTASRGVAERAGFSFEGVLRQDSVDVDGRPRDTAVYARVRGVEEP